MEPEKGQHIKVVFRNGMVEEGIVLSWTNQKASLKSLSSNNLLIIQDTTTDVLAIKIFQYPYSNNQPVYIDEELELPQPEKDPGLRAAKLAELRILRGRAERERARQRMNSFSVSQNNPFEERYGIPGRLQKPIRFDP